MNRKRNSNGKVYTQFETTKNSDPLEIQPIIRQRWAFLEQARHFIYCLQTGSPTISPASDAIKDLEIGEQYIQKLNKSKEDE